MKLSKNLIKYYNNRYIIMFDMYISDLKNMITIKRYSQWSTIG